MNTKHIEQALLHPQALDVTRPVASNYAELCAEAAHHAALRGQASFPMDRSDLDCAETCQSNAIECVLIQNLGLDRSNQEDAARIGLHQIFCQGHYLSFVLATLGDGCGGMEGGEVASEKTCALLARQIYAGLDAAMPNGEDPLSRKWVKSVFTQAFRSANDEIMQTAQEHPTLRGMASTGVCALVHGDTIDVAWAGDSRAELYRAGKAILATTDHNRAQALVNAGILTPEEAAGHPGRSHLTNALGTHVDKDQIPDVTRWRLAPGDLVVLSSDGFHEGITPSLMAQVCAAYLTPPVCMDDLRTMARVLESESLRAYGGDNLTAVFMYVRKIRSI